MTDKVQKIRKEVVRLKSNLIHGACASQIAMETLCKEEAYDEVISLLDSLQEEPVSEDLISVAKQYIDSHVFGNEEDKFTRSVLVDMFCSGAMWQKEQDQSTIELAEDHAMLAGMEKMEQQMMAKAVDGYVIEDIEEGNGDFLLSADYLPKSMGLKDRQKVKVIVIKVD